MQMGVVKAIQDSKWVCWRLGKWQPDMLCLKLLPCLGYVASSNTMKCTLQVNQTSDVERHDTIVSYAVQQNSRTI